VRGASTPAGESLLRPRVVLPFLAVALIWGSTWLVIKGGAGSVPPAWSVCYRFAVSALGTFVLAIGRRDSLRLDAQGWRLAAGIGLFHFTINYQFLYPAEQHLTSGLVAVLYALLMVPNALLAHVFLGQRVARGFWAGSAVALAGITLLVMNEVRVAPATTTPWLGIGMVTISILGASVANVIQASGAARSRPVLPILAWGMAIGTLADGLIALTLSGPPSFDRTWPYVSGVLYLSLVGSVITFPLYFQLIKDMGAGRAAYNGVLVPVVAMTLSTLFEGYRWTALAVAGSVLAMVGLVMALRARNPSR
jgi:drug/metabolite transporter (DMT)-like permease